MSEHNPYAPPAATVQDAQVAGLQEGRKRPTAVVVAVVLLALGLAYNGFGLVAMLRYVNTGFVAPVFFVWTLGRWILVTLVCVQLWRGRNWARILLLLLTVLNLLSLWSNFWVWMHPPAGVNLPASVMGVVTLLVAPVIYLAAVILVYGPGRAWFVRRA